MSRKIDGTVHSCVLPGSEQSNDRAEIYAIILALQLSQHCTVYSDCQYAIEAARVRMDCLRQSSRLPLMKHEDLWEVFDSLVVERPAQLVSILKVKTHVSLTTVLPDFFDKCRHYNHIADAAAKRAARDSALFSFNQLRVMNANKRSYEKLSNSTIPHTFLIQCARHEFAKTAGNRASTRFDVSILDVSTACFSHVALVDDEALKLCPYSYEFAVALLSWANGLQWAHSHVHANTSMTELLLNFIFTTGTHPPVNVNRFRDGKRAAYAMRDRCTQDLPLEAFTFAEDLRTFQAALKWFRKRAKVDLLPGDFVVNCRSLYVLGYSRPTKSIFYRIRHVCEPDPRAHLQDLFMQRSARK